MSARQPAELLFFALTLHDFLRATDSDLDREGEILEKLHLDDVIFMGTHSHLLTQLARFDSATAKEFGLHLRIDKSKFWWPKLPQESIRQQCPSAEMFKFNEEKNHT